MGTEGRARRGHGEERGDPLPGGSSKGRLKLPERQEDVFRAAATESRLASAATGHEAALSSGPGKEALFR